MGKIEASQIPRHAAYESYVKCRGMQRNEDIAHFTCPPNIFLDRKRCLRKFS
jgi:hypothetical protein